MLPLLLIVVVIVVVAEVVSREEDEDEDGFLPLLRSTISSKLGRVVVVLVPVLSFPSACKESKLDGEEEDAVAEAMEGFASKVAATAAGLVFADESDNGAKRRSADRSPAAEARGMSVVAVAIAAVGAALSIDAAKLLAIVARPLPRPPLLRALSSGDDAVTA